MKNDRIIYLNHKKDVRGDICILYFKKNNVIEQRIQQNDWISWNNNIHQYVVQSTPQTVGLLKDILQLLDEQAYKHNMNFKSLE